MIHLLLQRRLKKIIERNSKVLNKKIKIAILISGRGSNMQALVKACDSAEFPAEVALVLSNKLDA